MTMYTAPLKDIQFVLNHVADINKVTAAINRQDDITPDLVDAVLTEAGKLAADVIAPTNHTGDQTGSRHHEDGRVTTPAGFAEAYQAMAEGGWTAMDAAEEYGGQNMPMVVSSMVNEIWQSANMAFALCHLLTQGQVYALQKSASEEQKNLYLPPMLEGRWTGTMNLTEPQAGTDLAAIKTKAVKTESDALGTHYRISGQKIYITYGEHDMAENIIHLVLARTPDAPEGVKGISVFIVPKFLVNADGSLGERNDVHCVSIEKKLGIKGSPTAVLSYGDNEGAVGYLVGEENRGLEIMFGMMNHARFSVGLQGLAVSERALQQAIGYAMDRKQGTPLGGQSGDAIINHPDVLRIITTMKAEIEAMRALAAVGGAAMDLAHGGAEADRAFWDERAALLVPIIKGWLTERSLAVTSLGVQVHGGMGFIEETGAAQHYRDARILPIYEGTTAIQANDLVFRKTLRDEGKAVFTFLDEIDAEMITLAGNDHPVVASAAMAVTDALADARLAINHILSSANDPRRSAVSGSNYVMLMGYLAGGWLMARSAAKAAEQLEADGADENFLNAKLVTADSYMGHALPQVMALARSILAGDDAVLAMRPDWLQG
ncbi:MAG: acyl-CoA dehydrogenase [Alphaproteobacteria bacterium]|nr:acyl-CoA dehydrogenase [Alphaproteobacteria bacterium]